MTATNFRRTARAGAILGLASLALVACGRDSGSDAPVEQGEAIGDGKAWIRPVESVVRVRTGETGDDAV